MTPKQKIYAITPMSCLIIYLFLGFVIEGKAWFYGAFIFLLIPLMPYIIGQKKATITVGFCISLVYIIGCLVAESFGQKWWHPGWLIFLLIPIIKILILPSKIKNNEKIYKDTIEVESEEK